MCIIYNEMCKPTTNTLASTCCFFIVKANSFSGFHQVSYISMMYRPMLLLSILASYVQSFIEFGPPVFPE